MAYVLPRAVIVLVGWGATYFILTALSTHLVPSVVYITGVAWVLAGVGCFGYLYKLRREMGLLQLRPPAVPAKPVARHIAAAKKPAVLQPSPLARLRAALLVGRSAL